MSTARWPVREAVVVDDGLSDAHSGSWATSASLAEAAQSPTFYSHSSTPEKKFSFALNNYDLGMLEEANTVIHETY